MSLSLGLGAGGAAPALNAYWGQTGGLFLRDICDSGVNYATVSFINNSPEHGDGYPGSNFGANCAGEVYTKDGKATKLLSACSFIQRDIPYCQSKGVKVLLAIGGAAIPGTSDYDVSSEEKGVEFAQFLYNAFGPYKSSWTGPRPFDKSPTEHVSVDGFDLDLEDRSSRFSNAPYIAMVDWWRKQSHKMFITAAPECVITRNGNFNQNDELIANAEFDALFIQFYNNPVCDAIPNNTPGDEFSYDDWASAISKGKSKDAKLYIGLPASTDSAGSGYIVPKAMKDLVCEYSAHKNFGGLSLWDATRAMNNQDSKGKSFLESAVEAVQYVCREPPKTTSSTPTSTQITSTTSSTTVKTTSASSTTSSEPTTTSTSSEKPTVSSSSTKLTTSSIKSGNVTTSSIPSGKPTSSSATSEKPDTTSVITTASATKSATTSSVRMTSSIHWANSTATRTIQTTSKPVSMTTSTVYTTSVHTVTECPPTATDCPVSHVTTETIALYTTVCPVTETAQPPKPTTTKAPVMTTSTVYTTKTYTITKCPPTVTDCPVGHVTTEVIPAYTTVCPVKETETGNVPKPTGPALLSAATETTVATKTIKVQQPSSLATSIRSTAVVPQPSGKGCSGPSCPGATNAPGSGCTGPECPGVAIPTNSWTNKHGSGCTGPQCSGVAISTNAWTSSPVGPSAVPSSPVTAGASTLALGLTGLVAIVAAQVLAL